MTKSYPFWGIGRVVCTPCNALVSFVDYEQTLFQRMKAQTLRTHEKNKASPRAQPPPDGSHESSATKRGAHAGDNKRTPVQSAQSSATAAGDTTAHEDAPARPYLKEKPKQAAASAASPAPARVPTRPQARAASPVPAHVPTRPQARAASPARVPARPQAHAVVKMLQAIHWRPQSSGRATVGAWLQEVVAQTSRSSKASGVEGHRIALKNALLAEDTSSGKHPSQVHPKNCAHDPYTFRIWPDKVQALVAFDRVMRGAHVPESLYEGVYAPVALYKPRLTVVSITPAQDGRMLLHFAERKRPWSVDLDKCLRQLHLPRERDAEAYKTATVAALLRLRDVCGSHDDYLSATLLPALKEQEPPDALPTFGLCSREAIKMACRHEPHDPVAVIVSLKKYVQRQQERIAAYPEHLFIPPNGREDPLEDIL